MPSDEPEINLLTAFFHSIDFRLEKVPLEWVSKAFIPHRCSIKNESLLLLIQDEYKDLEYPNTLLHLVLVLRELELMEDSTDYLNWCKMQGVLTHSEPLRNYYQEMVRVHIPKLKNLFKHQKITSFISDLDFQLNSGPAQFLRNTTYP